jgi:hypothetical protein
LATRALIKSIHQTPFLASVWSRLSTRLVQLEGDCNTMTSSALIMTCASKSRTAQEQSLAYENAAISSGSIKKAQRSVMTAPWRLSAWQVLANSC